MKPEDQRIKGMKKGDKKATESLISSYYDEIYVFAYRQIGEKESAMDMTQEIFLSAWQTIHGYDHRKASFRTWLYRIAANKIIDYRRKKRPILVPIDESELPNHFDANVEERAFVQEIEDFISKLDVTLQQTFRLHLYGGFTFIEIASLLREPEAKIKTQYYRLLKQLRKEFSDE